ncbi:YopX family protein [Streptococcus infantarius]|uniref:YopX family protein n=1 Tax=Streptococcus infantarius TaxID=102684 RepID=UPI003D110E48
MKPKFRAWLKEEQRMVDVREMTFMYDEVYLISDVTDFYAYEEFKLMQSTGLRDKNGKEIFEGDVVKYEVGRNTYTEEVAYDKNFAGFGVKDAKANVVFTFGEIAEDISLISLEVVGNIYENPELLGGK